MDSICVKCKYTSNSNSSWLTVYSRLPQSSKNMFASELKATLFLLRRSVKKNIGKMIITLGTGGRLPYDIGSPANSYFRLHGDIKKRV